MNKDNYMWKIESNTFNTLMYVCTRYIIYLHIYFHRRILNENLTWASQNQMQHFSICQTNQWLVGISDLYILTSLFNLRGMNVRQPTAFNRLQNFLVYYPNTNNVTRLCSITQYKDFHEISIYDMKITFLGNTADRKSVV